MVNGLCSERAPPVEAADRLNASLPHHMAVGINQRKVQAIAEADKFTLSPFATKENDLKGILDAMQKVGFRLNWGIKDTGFGTLALDRAGGY